MTALLLVLWLATSFGTVFFARELARFELFGWPLSFYMAAQGAALISLASIGFYAWRMRRIDRDARAQAEVQPEVPPVLERP
jgi:putative solute:sodium symporter small subunit